MEMERRIKEHPILGEIEKGKQVAFTYEQSSAAYRRRR